MLRVLPIGGVRRHVFSCTRIKRDSFGRLAGGLLSLPYHQWVLASGEALACVLRLLTGIGETFGELAKVHRAQAHETGLPGKLVAKLPRLATARADLKAQAGAVAVAAGLAECGHLGRRQNVHRARHCAL